MTLSTFSRISTAYLSVGETVCTLCILCVFVVYISVDSSTVGQTYPIAFMNITPDVQEQGYIQIYAVAQSDMTIRLSVILSLSLSL